MVTVVQRFYCVLSLMLAGSLAYAELPSATAAQSDRAPSPKLLWSAGIATLGITAAIAAKLKIYNPRRVKTQKDAEHMRTIESHRASYKTLNAFAANTKVLNREQSYIYDVSKFLINMELSPGSPEQMPVAEVINMTDTERAKISELMCNPKCYNEFVDKAWKNPLFEKTLDQALEEKICIGLRYEQRLHRLKLEQSPRIVDRVKAALSWW